jgi:exodeoxyribonuclease VII small subunit
MAEGDDLGYADALAELEAILAELEDDVVDVDRLGERVRRAAELVALCRSRIDAARIDVTRVVSEFAEPDATADPDPG